MEASLSALVAEARIEARPEIIVKPPEQSIDEVIHAHSKTAALVFLGLMEPEPGAEESYAERMGALSAGLGTVVFVRHAGEFSGQLI